MLGVPHWGPHDKGILLFGGLTEGCPIFVNPKSAHPIASVGLYRSVELHCPLWLLGSSPRKLKL